jgi:bacteriophage N4 adsorption protein B
MTMGWGEMVMAIDAIRAELLLFAAMGIVIGGIDDLLVDIIYGVRRFWRGITVYRRHAHMRSPDLPECTAGTLAVLIPAWDESMVIGAMLRHTLRAWAGERVHLFVGCYPNDPATVDAVAAVAAGEGAGRVTLVVVARPGPTTKADCLNQLWSAVQRWEVERGEEALAIVLHDAEDVVHPDAARLMKALAPRFALVQLPVLPLPASGSRWISGHYCDEFAEAHGKALLVREALGAALPSAGVGCAFRRAEFAAMALARGGMPFDPGSLTEDYELGLRIGEAGGRGILVRMRDGHGQLIATREYFPDTLSASVAQKARWMVGIALAGWDRLGWQGSWGEYWMRLRDRRALMAAAVLLAAYLGAVLTMVVWIIDGLFPREATPMAPWRAALFGACGALLVWRLAVRALFVGHAYGWREALRSVPRSVLANAISLLAAWRALGRYMALLRGGSPIWDKTAHRFPDIATDAAR